MPVSTEAQERTRILQRVLKKVRPLRRLSVWLRYTLATLIVLAFFGLRSWFDGELNGAPYLLFVPAIILVSAGLDRGTGFYATLFSAALSAHFLTPNWALHVSDLLALSIFILTGLFCATVIEALRLVVDALDESETRFRMTFELAAVGIALVGLDGRWLKVNPRLCSMLGYSEDELLSRTFQDITHPDDLEADIALLRRLLTGAVPSYSLEKRYLTKSGDPIWISLAVAMVRPIGETAHFISVVQDISERKAAEAVLARSKTELEHLVEARTAALMRASDDQRRAEEALRQGEKLQALGQLTGGIAHDFNNLLQVVSGGAQLLKSPRLTPERRTAILDGLIQAAQNAKDLTGQLLAFARRQPLQPETFDLNARIRGMSALLGQTLGPAVRVETNLADDLWPVRVDPSQLEIAVLNLAINARDAMPSGGTLTLLTRNSVTGTGDTESASREHVDLLIRDDGHGMAAAVLSRVFEPFFTTKEAGKGTGLGLAQVYGFVKQSGGDITIDSALGQGTTITLRLPRIVGQDQRAATAAGPAAPSDWGDMIERASGKRVLVVEDNADVAAFASALLEELGYGTLLAQTASEALDLLATSEEPIDAVFSDVMMPGGMNGLQLAARLRDQHPHVAVVLVSGYSDALRDWDGERPAEVLSKPYRLDALGQALSRALAASART